MNEGTGSMETSTSLLGLPNEILIQILEDLDKELLYLATLSHRLHYLALPIYLAHHGVSLPLSLNNLILSGDHFTCILPALTLALFIRSAKTISCTFHTPDPTTLKDIQLLNKFLSKLQHVEKVNLDFGRLTDYWTKSVNGLNWTKWTEEIRLLLCLCAKKRCLELRIRNGESQAMAVLSGCSHLREPAVTETVYRAVGTRDVIKRSNGVAVGKSTPTEALTGGIDATRIYAIETLDIRSCMVFCSDFNKWATHTINNSPIRHLTIDTPWLEDPGAILPSLHTPKLESLAVHCKVEYTNLYNFLIRHHQTMTELTIDSDLYNVSTVPSTSGIGRWRQHFRTINPFPRLPKNTLMNLTTLRATPEYLARLLESSNALPQLKTVTILLHVPCNQRFSFSTVNRALAGISHRLRKTQLSMKLFVECEHVHWVDLGQDDTETNLQQHITSLELNIPCSVLYFLAWPFRPDIAAFPQCIARFPKLKHFALVDWPYKPDETTEFVRLLAERCSWIESVGINGETLKVAAWM